MELPSAISFNGQHPDAPEEDTFPFQLTSQITAESGSSILDVSLERNCCSSFAVCLSSKKIKVFSLVRRSCIREIIGPTKTIGKVKFSFHNSSLLYSSSLDGTITLWDLRTKICKVQEYFDETDQARKPITTFDFNADENYVCGGTELIRDDSYLLFWDRRSTRLLGGYWYSHTDDITEVVFHPQRRNILSTGSVDGLMNIFDLNQTCEDNALISTLNTGSSVGKMMWDIKNPNISRDNSLSCITHTEEIQLWNINDANPNIVLNREFFKIQSGIGIDYLVGTFGSKDSLYLVTGTHSGDAQVWEVGEKSTFVWSQLNSGHKDDVRGVAWNGMYEAIITAGDDGVISVWKKVTSPNKDRYKMESHMKKLSLKHSSNPY